MHRLSAIVLALLLLATAAVAQGPIPKGNVFFGYSYLSADLVTNDRANLNGWNGSLEGKVFPYVGIVADLSGHYGTTNLPLGPGNPGNAHLYNFLFGPRVSVSVGKLTPFAEALFGAAHTNIGGDTDTSFSEAVGGGIDYKLIPAVAWRVEVDYLHTRLFNDPQNNVRISTGVVLHF